MNSDEKYELLREEFDMLGYRHDEVKRRYYEAMTFIQARGQEGAFRQWCEPPAFIRVKARTI